MIASPLRSVLESGAMRRRDLLWACAAFFTGRLVSLGPGRPALASETQDSSTARPVVVAAGGDTVLGFNLQDHFDAQLETGQTREQLWPLYFAGVKGTLSNADLRIVNLECPFTERGTRVEKNFNFRARPELVEILKSGGVNVVTLANNHTMDFGPDGVEDTMATLRQAGIASFGAGTTLARARSPAILRRHGLKIGFLGYYFQSGEEMIEPQSLYATSTTAGVAGCYVSLECVKQQVTDDVSRLVPRVHAVIVYFHWGKENSTEVRDYQSVLAHLCVDLGCKAVLGAHPHRLQGVEVYKDAPIFYSLGNFVYGGRKDPQDKLSAIALLRIHKDGAIAAELVPIQITRWPEAPYQPFVLSDTAREDALNAIAALSSGFGATLPMLAPYLQKEHTPTTSSRTRHHGSS